MLNWTFIKTWENWDDFMEKCDHSTRPNFESACLLKNPPFMVAIDYYYDSGREYPYLEFLEVGDIAEFAEYIRKKALIEKVFKGEF